MRLSAAWAAVALTVTLSVSAAYINLEKSLAYNNAITEMTAEKVALSMERQALLEQVLAAKTDKLAEHEVRITVTERDVSSLNNHINKYTLGPKLVKQ